MTLYLSFFFFFSSRRRHTRFDCDWSSDVCSSDLNAEKGLQHYMARPYLAGLFYWTGFDYRGESNPYGFPAISSQFGILDTCGFPKDTFHYLKSWWHGEPMLVLAPHWNFAGREGQPIEVRAFTNASQVELFLNGRSLGR